MTRVSIHLNPSNLGSNSSFLNPPFSSIDNDLDEPFKPKKKPNRQDSIKLTIKYYDQKNKNTSETIGEEDEADVDDDDKATVEAVRTEATRAREPFMFSLWVFLLIYGI